MEISEYIDALHTYRVALTYLQEKHARLTRKLLTLCHCENGYLSARLDERGDIVVSDSGQAGGIEVFIGSLQP